MAAAQVKRMVWEPSHVVDMLPTVQASPFGPLEGPLDVLGDSCLYELTEGAGRALIAVKPVTMAHGRRLDVVGLESLGDRLRAATVAQALDDLAARHHADQLAMCTNHAHIVKGASRHGWTISGLVLIKRTNRVQ